MILVVAGSSDLAAPGVEVGRARRSGDDCSSVALLCNAMSGCFGAATGTGRKLVTASAPHMCAAAFAAAAATAAAAFHTGLPSDVLRHPHRQHKLLRTRKEDGGHLQLNVDVRNTQLGSQPQRCQPRRLGAVILAAACQGWDGSLARCAAPLQPQAAPNPLQTLQQRTMETHVPVSSQCISTRSTHPSHTGR